MLRIDGSGKQKFTLHILNLKGLTSNPMKPISNGLVL